MFKKEKILAPCNGEVIMLEDVQDPVFSQKMMGDGFAIIPEDGVFVSPCDGEITVVFDTKHAYGIKNKKTEILIHIGLDTVKLNGEGFESFVKVGDIVKAGDRIAKVDINFVSEKVPSMQTPIIVTNKKEFNILKTGNVKAGDEILEIK